VKYNERLREKTRGLLPKPQVGINGGRLARNLHERLRAIEYWITAHDKTRPITSDDIIAADIAERDKTESFIRNHNAQVIDKHRETDGVEEAVDFHDFTDPAPMPTLIEAVKSAIGRIHENTLGLNSVNSNHFFDIADSLVDALADAKADDAKRRNELDALRKFHEPRRGLTSPRSTSNAARTPQQ